MTGKEAIDKLKEGYTLKRKDWDSNQKCKAFFSDNKINPEFVPEEPKYKDYISFYDALDNGDFLEDDWEIHEWDDSEEIRPVTQLAKEIIEDYKQAVNNGEIVKG